MSVRPLAASLLLLAVATLAAGQVIEAPDTESVVPDTKPAKTAGEADVARAAAMIVDKTNEFRKSEGRAAVTINPKLEETARYFAGFMARTDKYGHTADGNRPSDRARQHGYEYCIIAENIAYEYDSRGFTTERLATGFFEGWKHSPHHRKNMLDPDVIETGVAVAQSPDTGYYYAVQMFGRPRSDRIEFQIANRSGETIRYQLGDKTFPLPPRYTRTHQRCRPGDLTFRWPDDVKEDPKTVRPHTGDRFVVERTAAGKFEVEQATAAGK
jgi:uncharacterized protein YkwD